MELLWSIGQAVQFVTQSQLGDVLPSINLKAGNGASLLLFVNVPIYIYIYGSMPINYHIPGGMNIHLPSGKLTLLLNMASYSELPHQQWWFSIVMLVYQRVRAILVFTRVSNKLDRQSFPSFAAGQKHTRDLDSDVEVDEVPHVMVKKAKVGTHKWCKSQSLCSSMLYRYWCKSNCTSHMLWITMLSSVRSMATFHNVCHSTFQISYCLYNCKSSVLHEFSMTRLKSFNINGVVMRCFLGPKVLDHV